ncbi:GNAT family N-acetyltransferase [Alteromonas sp. 5E99-2]|uniref:MSMEG_0567/Sll0786 family nitrogen starvation N-acetyltransferase n=1 Tax=Alteromonas sp. 5E99-2 TaxID=2817683 RepID=UPI001A99668D|nr:MSMEG_0567/Sll0786 family nitrogen starvation N-acetyltransferase [Alteromonas sp. 5E99-2]MBO1255502.1 GNAT family N-acetyltransferase [Alteromonas sp. 5E99-2]
MQAIQQEYFSDFTIKWATSEWEKHHAYALRRQVFCGEQGIFEIDDKDDIDNRAQVLVAIANHGGWHEKVVGTVRIHHEGNHVWWGSRLAVDASFRTQTGLGSLLIKLAVSSAHALGCKVFLAQVQKQNERLFQRLNWKSQYELMLKEHLHVMMKAELASFPPCYHPESGFVVSNVNGPFSTLESLAFLQPDMRDIQEEPYVA